MTRRIHFMDEMRLHWSLVIGLFILHPSSFILFDGEERTLRDSRWLDGNEARHILDELLKAALPIRFAGPFSTNAGGDVKELPLVQLDATARPDVADLFRVAAAEGHQSRTESAFRYLFLDGHGYMEVNVEISDPVTCAFTFVLRWPEHRALFELMLQGQPLMFTAASAPGQPQTRALGFKITASELQPVIATWRRLRHEDAS